MRRYPSSKIRSSGCTLLEQPWRDTPHPRTEDEMAGWHHRLNGHEFGSRSEATGMEKSEPMLVFSGMGSVMKKPTYWKGPDAGKD